MFTAVKRKVKCKRISNTRKGKCIVFPKHSNPGKVQELYVILLRKVIFFVYLVQLPEPDIQNFIKIITFFLYRRSYNFFLLFLFLYLILLFLLTTKEFAAT
jgi:hypothetical protein